MAAPFLKSSSVYSNAVYEFLCACFQSQCSKLFGFPTMHVMRQVAARELVTQRTSVKTEVELQVDHVQMDTESAAQVWY